MFKTSVGEDISVKRGGFVNLAYPHGFNNGEYEGGGAACVV